MSILSNATRSVSYKLLLVLIANAIILALWLWLFRPVYPYLGTIFTRQEFRTNQVVLLAILILIVLQVRREGIKFPMLSLPQLHPIGLALALSGAAAFIAAERWLQINTLSASLFGLATYGLLGLWLDPHSWRKGLPAALLLVGVLPFGEHMDTFIGYPLRLFTARMVSQGLAAMGVPNMGVDTILVFENGLSQVDSPCSGVKSLWSGGLFILAATWIEHRPINRRWILAVIGFALLLLTANLARVAVLVLVGQVAGWGLLAELLHVPLGVLGFVAACLAAVAFLRWTGRSSTDQPGEPIASPRRPGWLPPVLAAALVLLIFLYVPRPQSAAASTFEWDFPEGMDVRSWPLTDAERNWLSDGGALPVNGARWRFEWQDVSGSLLLVASDTWRSHHRPERCFTVYGLEVQESQLHLIAADFPLRWLTLSQPGNPKPLYTAGYWLQSNGLVTDDYAVRIWDDLQSNPQPWVLVTVLFDEPVDVSSDQSEALFAALRRVVQAGLQTGAP